jgi:hypothetical protein
MTIKVNPLFRYEEREILRALNALLRKSDLKLSSPDNSGTVLTSNNEVHVSHGSDFTVTHALVDGMSEATDNKNLDFIEAAVQTILQSKETQLRHTIFFPINLIEVRHFCLGVISFYTDAAGEKPVIIPDVRIAIIDTIDGNKNITSSMIDMVGKLLQKHSICPDKFTYERRIMCPRQQPDGTSCGVLVAQAMQTMITGGDLYQGRPYSKDEVNQFRIEQLKAIDDPVFAARQFETEQDPQLSEPVQTQDCDKLLTYLLNYLHSIDSTDKDELKKIALVFVICELNLLRMSVKKSKYDGIVLKLTVAQKILRDITDPELTFAQTNLDDNLASAKSREYSSKIKSWFIKHRDTLRSAEYGGFLDVFFRTELDPKDNQLIWTPDGMVALFSVFEIYFGLDKLEVEHSRSDSHSSSDNGELTFVDTYDPKSCYRYEGSVNNQFQAVGAGVETYPDTTYVGEFNVTKVGFGLLEHYIDSIQTRTYFRGLRNDDGTFKYGNVFCIVGEPFHNANQKMYVLFKGELVDGEISGYGSLILAACPSNDEQLFIHAKFESNKIVKIVDEHMPSDLTSKLMEHFLAYNAQLRLYEDPIDEVSTEHRNYLLKKYMNSESDSESEPEPESKPVPDPHQKPQPTTTLTLYDSRKSPRLVELVASVVVDKDLNPNSTDRHSEELTDLAQVVADAKANISGEEEEDELAKAIRLSLGQS